MTSEIIDRQPYWRDTRAVLLRLSSHMMVTYFSLVLERYDLHYMHHVLVVDHVRSLAAYKYPTHVITRRNCCSKMRRLAQVEVEFKKRYFH